MEKVGNLLPQPEAHSVPRVTSMMTSIPVLKVLISKYFAVHTASQEKYAHFEA